MTGPANTPLPVQRTPAVLVRRFWWPTLLVGALVLLLWALVTGWPGPISARDVRQTRADVVTPRPDAALELAQTFTPQRAGLAAIELRVRRGDAPTPDNGRLTLTLRDAAGIIVASETVRTDQLEDNETLTLAVPRQSASAGRPYTLTLRGSDNATISFWAYSLDTYGGGALSASDGTPTPADLVFTTRYRLTFSSALSLLASIVWREAAIMLVTLAIVLLPGTLFWQSAPAVLPGVGRTARIALTLALGIALWALFWQWLTLLLPLSGPLMWLLLLGGWALAAFNAWRRGETPRRLLRRPSLTGWLMAALLLLALALRLLAARDLAYPPWVDSTRHALITMVMVDSGRLLTNYRPFLDIAAGPYHYGFHTLPASVIMMTGSDLAQTLLAIGQWFNALVALAVFAAALLIGRRPPAALVAALLVALPMFFPAYYLSWGRLTQLTGLLILPPLLGWTWRLLEPAAAQRPGWRGWLTADVVAVGVLAAGLFLVHFRVFLLYLPFAVLIGVWRWRTLSRLVLAGALSGALVVPRLLVLLRRPEMDALFATSDNYNDFPTGYFTAGWERPLLLLTAGVLLLALLRRLPAQPQLRGRAHLALLLALVVYVAAGEWFGWIAPLASVVFLRTALLIGLWLLALRLNSRVLWALAPALWLAFEPQLANVGERGAILAGLLLIVWLAADDEAFERQWSAPILLLAGWVALLFALLLGQRVGLPESWIVNLNSMVIALFVPQALAIGLAAPAVWRWLRRRHWLVQLAGYAGLGALLAATLLFGSQRQIAILNESTVLVEPTDRAGLAWLAANTSPNALIAVSSWRWIGPTWAAQDGGAWILPAARRAVTMPPADYIYNADLIPQVTAFNEAATAIGDWSAAEATALLRDYGVTHVYVGARGGFLRPEQLVNNPALALAFAQDGVYIFEVRP